MNKKYIFGKGTGILMKNRISSAKTLMPLDVWAVAFGCIVGWGSFVMPGSTFIPLAGAGGTVLALLAGTLLMLIIGRNYSFLMEEYPV